MFFNVYEGCEWRVMMLYWREWYSDWKVALDSWILMTSAVTTTWLSLFLLHGRVTRLRWRLDIIIVQHFQILAVLHASHGKQAKKWMVRGADSKQRRPFYSMSYLMTHKTCIFRTKFEIPVPYKSTYSKLRHVYSYLDRCLLNILLCRATNKISTEEMRTKSSSW